MSKLALATSNRSSARRRVIALGAGLLASLSLATAAVAAARFSIKQINGPAGRPAYPLDLSENGTIAGAFDTGQRTESGFRVLHAYALSGSTVTEIPTLAGTGAAGDGVAALAFGVNDAGHVVGTSQVRVNGAPHAFLFRGGQLTDLNEQIGGETGQAFDINNAGVIVGTHGSNPNFGTAFVLRPDGSVIDLGPGVGYAVSDSGYVVGETLNGNGFSVPFVFRDANNNGLADAGETSLLGTLGGQHFNLALGVNASGRVVGQSTDASGRGYAVVWPSNEPGAAPQDLGNLGAGNSAALGINNAGLVVGHSNGRAFLYENGRMVDLASLTPTVPGHQLPIWQLYEASRINNAGRIVGQGVPINTAAVVGYLLTPGGGPPPPPTIELASLTIEPSNVVLRTQPVKVKVTIALSAKPRGVVTIPLVLKVNGVPFQPPRPLVVKLKKKQSGTLELTFQPDAQAATYDVSATYGGVTKSATLLVQPAVPVKLESLSITPDSVRAGGKVVARISLTDVPEGRVEIPLTFSKDGTPIILPKPVVVKLQGRAGQLKITIPAILPAGIYVVSATYGGETRTASLTVTQ